MLDGQKGAGKTKLLEFYLKLKLKLKVKVLSFTV